MTSLQVYFRRAESSNAWTMSRKIDRASRLLKNAQTSQFLHPVNVSCSILRVLQYRANNSLLTPSHHDRQLHQDSAMATSSSAVSSTLSRYRPAILIVTGLTAAYGVWILQAHFASSSEPPQRPLRRRGAIHERRRGGRLHLSAAQGRHPWYASHDGDHQTQRFQHENFGTYFIEDPSGQQFAINLEAASLPSAETFQNQFGFTRGRAIAARNEIENSYLDAMLFSTLPASAYINPNGRDGEMLREDLTAIGFDDANIIGAVERHNRGDPVDVENRTHLSTALSTNDRIPVENTRTVEALDGRETVVGADSAFSWRGDDGEGGSREGQNLLNLLYHIAEDQARKEGYVHRGVTCNSCGNMPIRGIRYRCANCIDYDLCETCEAMQIHHKTHLFYKVRIPAPFLGNPRQAQPVWYPGKPATLPNSVPRDLADRLMKETNFESPEIEALWDQYRCLAGSEWLEDPNDIGVAIDRRTFDKCFVPNTAIRPPPPNLIYDRMFAFYDTNCDGLIGFEEFIKGLASLNNKTKDERLRRIFQGYDIDGDGFVNRKDFLRMFRAFYALSKELTKDMVAGFDDDSPEGATTARDIVLGSQPISSAFQWQTTPRGEPARGEGKRRASNGDDEIIDGGGVVRENGDDRGNPNAVVADAAERAAIGHLRPSEPRRYWESMLLTEPHANGGPVGPAGETLTAHNEQEEIPEAGDEDDSASQGNEEETMLPGSVRFFREPPEGPEWPPRNIPIEAQDVEAALGSYIAVHEVYDPMDRVKVAMKAIERLNEWPPKSISIQAQDVEAALGSYIAVAEIHDLKDRAKVIRVTLKRMAKEDRRKRDAARAEGIRNRWRRRQFYLDEENGAEIPEAFDPSEEEEVVEDQEQAAQTNPRRSPRSRSSSKVRFEDDLMDPDEDTRSNPSTSSRSIPVGERWGGYEIPEAEKDVGKEILYQVTQQGLNEMLDPLFKEKEDLAMEALGTRAERKKWRAAITDLEQQGSQAKEREEGPKTASDVEAAMQRRILKSNHGTAVSPEVEDKAEDENDDAVDDKIHDGDGKAASASDIRTDDTETTSKVDVEQYSPAAEELQSSVATFNEGSSIRPDLRERSVRELMEASGYTITEAASSSTPTSHPVNNEPPPDPTLPQNRPNSIPPESPKPTNSTPSATTASSSSSPPNLLGLLVPSTPSEPANAQFYSTTAPHPSFLYDAPSTSFTSPHPSFLQDLPSTSFSTAAPNTSWLPSPSSSQPPAPPSFFTTSTAAERLAFLKKASPSNIFQEAAPPRSRLEKLREHDALDKENEKRGGPGRLSFEEFEAIMKGEKGRRLGFVGAWIEMASF